MARLRGVSLDIRSIADRFWSTSAINRAALIAGLLWAVLVVSYAGGYFAGAGGGQARGTAFLDAVFFLVALVLPLGVVALAAWLAAELARQREAVAALVAAVGPLSEALGAPREALAEGGLVSARDAERAVAAARAEFARDLGQAVQGPVAELREGQRRIEGALAAAGPPAAPATPAAPPPPAWRTGGRAPHDRLGRPAVAASAANEEAQPALPMPAPEPEAALGWDDLLRAFDFPRDAEDREGFRALRRALRHHSLAQMLQAAEDVLNLLSREGVYMDGLVHEPAPTPAWRAFLQGRRGEAVEAVGGIRDERALATVRTLMKADPIFRDTSLFFQRRFDGLLTSLAADADDAQLLALADTRSGRAFMLCARASGSFG